MKYVILTVLVVLSGCSSAPTVEQMMVGAYMQGRSGQDFDPSAIEGYEEYYSPRKRLLREGRR
jgi:uncharacterized protein YceK